jgi:SpoVK/Ycf46/Vps4 family AAA+-type ATPase
LQGDPHAKPQDIHQEYRNRSWRGRHPRLVGLPGGSGRAQAAEALAAELKIPLVRIDSSAVISKYIGETEKNLEQIFDRARATAAVVFFDEADALFGKRSDVKDSHDRFANPGVLSFLLQRLEAFAGGVSVIACTSRDSIDDAFARRCEYIIKFECAGRTRSEA